MLTRLQARIVLENEDKDAIARFQVETMPFYQLDSLSSEMISSDRVSS